MYSLREDDNKIQYGVKVFTCDTASDIDDIPTRDLKPGTVAIVIDTADGYMLNSKKEWVLL